MSFQNAVNAIPAISPYLKNGLQALGNNSRLVRPKHTNACDGSVDIDSCYKTSQPNSARWDYVIGYKGNAYFVEIHPANGEVSELIAKCDWLRTWLKAEGTPLAKIHGDGVFHWLSTGGVNLVGKNRAKLAMNKILVNKLNDELT